MAWSVLPNAFAYTAGQLLWRFKEFLVSQGWSVPRSGSGSGGAFSSSGDVHAPGGVYAGTLDLLDSWFELRQPATASPQRSFLFTIPFANNSIFRLWYSSDGTGFTGGTPSATARGTAADEEGLVNTPSSSNSFFGNPIPYVMDMVVGDASEGHSFFWGMRRTFGQTGSPGYDACIMLDVLADAHVLDQDPAVVGVHWTGSGIPFATGASTSGGTMQTNMSASQTQACIRGWFKKALTGATFVTYPFITYGAQEGGFGSVQSLTDDRLSTRPDGTFDDLPILYWRGSAQHTTQRGRKGTSRLFRTSQLRLGAMRPTNDLSRMCLGHVSIPWDGQTRPVL